MRLFAAVVGLLVLPFMSALAQGDSSRSESADAQQPNNGPTETWLSSDYVDGLRRTRSPHGAMGSMRPGSGEPCINVYQSETKWRWVSENFHERLYEFECDLDEYPGQREITFRSSYDTAEIVAHGTLLSADTLLLEYRDRLAVWSGKYVKANPSLEVFVNNLLLAGKYLNQEGDTCVFEESGVASWRFESFRYEIYLDCVFSYPDGFWIPDVWTPFGWQPYCHFQWKGKKLYIYDTYKTIPDGEYAIPYKEPLLILTPVKK
jgi:hypothetical protein